MYVDRRKRKVNMEYRNQVQSLEYIGAVISKLFILSLFNDALSVPTGTLKK
jgi:hypothetical protein